MFCASLLDQIQGYFQPEALRIKCKPNKCHPTWPFEGAFACPISFEFLGMAILSVAENDAAQHANSAKLGGARRLCCNRRLGSSDSTKAKECVSGTTKHSSWTQWCVVLRCHWLA